MKILFFSDIHGSKAFTERAMDVFKKEEGTHIVILGDVLYHGPRNDLPLEYNPKEVANLLNTFSDKIIAVRGNCDSEVDQMLLKFPMMADYSTIFYNEKRIFLTHGHIYNEENMPALEEGDIIIHGHTHILGEKNVNGIKIINPGSVSIPKGGNPNTYGILNENNFVIKDLEGNKIQTITI